VDEREDERVACPSCSRMFNNASLAVHARVCKKVFSSAPKASPSTTPTPANRVAGDDNLVSPSPSKVCWLVADALFREKTDSPPFKRIAVECEQVATRICRVEKSA